MIPKCYGSPALRISSSRDDVEEAPGDVLAAMPGGAKALPVRIGDVGQRRVARRLLSGDGRVMELVADERGPGRAERAVVDKARDPVPEVHPPLRVARLDG